MRYIQEIGFTFEAYQIEPKFPCSDELLRVVEDACWCASTTLAYGAVQICWRHAPVIVWYCRVGEDLYLRSIR